MKIILTNKESDYLTKYLNSDVTIKKIEFEESDIYVRNLAELIVEQINNLNERQGYIFTKRS